MPEQAGGVLTNPREGAVWVPVSGYAPINSDETALSSIGLKHLYTSRPWVAAGGAYWVRARWYAPAEGRFLSLDPRGYAGSGLSLYMYAGGDPVNLVDPLGESWFGTARQWADSYRDGIQSVKDAAGLSGDGWGAGAGGAFDLAVDVFLPDDAALRIGDSGIAEWVFGITTDPSDPCPRPLTGGERWGHLAGELGNALAAPGSLPGLGKLWGLGLKPFKHGFAALAKGKKSPIWSGTKKLTPAQNAYRHWKDHGRDFPQFKNAKEYVEGARDFVTHPPQGTLSKVRPNGDRVLFDPASGTFAVQRADGSPRTMYIPDPEVHGYPTNLEYFHGQ